ncbi:unnamed protein product [Ixodes persulcatus]
MVGQIFKKTRQKNFVRVAFCRTLIGQSQIVVAQLISKLIRATIKRIKMPRKGDRTKTIKEKS